MSAFAFFFGMSSASGQSDRFVTEQALQANLARQIAMSPRTMAELRNYGVTDDTSLKLEFFFYTNTPAKAEALAKTLEAKDYQVEFGPSASDSSLVVVSGWTTPLAMDEATVVSWTEQMTRIGYEHDCEFDGWGTNPNQ